MTQEKAKESVYKPPSFYNNPEELKFFPTLHNNHRAPSAEHSKYLALHFQHYKQHQLKPIATQAPQTPPTMSIVLKRMPEDSWPESFGTIIMEMLEAGSQNFQWFIGFLIILLRLVSLIAVPILIVRLSSALYKQWYDRNQPKQGSDEEVVMGTIASGGNEEDVGYGVVATDNAVEEVDERNEEIY